MLRLAALAFVLVVPQACARSRPAAQPSVKWEPHVEVASGPAIRGPWQQNESDYRWVDDPAIELLANGDAIVAWVDQERKDLFLMRFAPDGRPRWEMPVNVSKSPSTFSWLPRMTVDETEPSRVHLLWQEIIFSGGTHGGEILFASSSDGGRTFAAPQNLSSSIAGDGKGRLDEKTWDNGSLDLASGPGGALYATWTEYEGTLWLATSRDHGATWSAKRRIAGERDKPARAPSIAVDQGRVFLAWAVGEDRDGDVYIAASSDAGQTFAAPVRLGEETGHFDAPQIAVDRAGTLHLVHTKNAGGTPRVHYARMKRGATTFEPSRAIAEGSAPTVGVDDRGRVFLAWERHDGDRREGVGFAASRDGGDRFSHPANVPGVGGGDLGVNGSQQGNLADKLAIDRNGAMAIVNSTFDASRASRVRFVRGRLVE